MRQFYGHLEKCVLSAGKTLSVKFPFFGGGGFGGGGGECRFYFYGRADFSERWIDALKKRGRVLKKRRRVLKKRGRFLRRGV